MPFVHNEGAELYWTAEGSGPPVLLIMGLSYSHEMWFRTLPALTRHHRAILFDNRGMGRSSVPPGPYRISRMARDAYAVLRAAGEESADVVGASMGGMIAQELALQFPSAVRSLNLGCTSHSGILGRWPQRKHLPFGRRWSRLTPHERDRTWVTLLYADTTPLERVDEDFAVRSRCVWTQQGFRNQLGAILLWSAYRRLPRIQAPTLVVHGDQDRLIPPVNGRALARRIPGARFELVRDAGHMLTTDQPAACADLMLDFLERSVFTAAR